jgi:hypothetical protein
MTDIKTPSASSDAIITPVLLTQIYNRATVGITATAINASIFTLVIKDVVSKTALTIWYSMIILFALLRFLMTINMRRNPALLMDTRKSKRLLVIGIGISGLLWGSTAIFLFPAQSIGHQALLAFILAGMVAGAVGVFSSIMAVFLSFSIPTLLPITIRFAIFGDEVHMAMAVMTLIFGLLTFATAQYVKVETRELVALKETFSIKLDERTETLMETNMQLETEIERRKDTELALVEERDKLQQMVDEIRTLRGFIPICSSCKKIRDDAGCWQQLEKYIQEHSDATFSHGICPECLKSVYPEIDEED